MYDAAGKLVGIQGVFSDVTDRCRPRRLWSRSASRLDSPMQHLPDYIYFKDAEGADTCGSIPPSKAAARG